MTQAELALALTLATRAEHQAKGALEECERWLRRMEDQRKILAFEYTEATRTAEQARAALEESTT